MHALKQFALTIFVLALLAAVSDVLIFHGQAAVNLLKADVAPRILHRLFELAIALLAGLALLGLLVVLLRVARRVASFARYVWTAPGHSYDALEPKDRIAAENDLRATRIQVITTVVQALGGIAVLIGIYFAWANLKTTQESQKDTQKSQAETLRITSEGQITDRFTKAIDQPGATDNQGNPRLELRPGGIYALERIARESEEDHWPIMEVLTTYARVHASLKTSDSDLRRPNTSNANCRALVPISALSPDIQTIVTIIGRRERRFENGNDEWLNLSYTNLIGANLIGAHLEAAHLEGANLSGAYLGGADLEGTHLKGHPPLPDVTGLTQEQLKLTKGNKETELPDGLVIPAARKQGTAATTTAQPKSP